MSLEKNMMVEGLTKLEEMMEDRYYIYPPRKVLFQKFVRIWLALFVCAIGSIGFLAVIFFMVEVFLYFHYKPFIRLWSIYDSKFVLFLMTLLVLIISFFVAPFIRGLIWSLICSF